MDESKKDILVTLEGVSGLYGDLRGRIFSVENELGTEIDTATTTAENALTTAQNALNTVNSISTIDLRVLNDTEYDPTTLKPTLTGGQSNIIYLVPDNTSESNDTYMEWLYVGNDFEKIGTTNVDLSGYVQGTVATTTEITDMMTAVKNSLSTNPA